MNNRRPPLFSRQFAAVALAVLLAACGSDDGKRVSLGTAPAPDAFLGMVVADEPQAALIGRDIFFRGGNAVDAAVGAAAAMAVTLPSRASLAGGGVCIVYDKASNTASAIDFAARTPASGTAAAQRPSAVPGTPRGLSVLHARYGRLHWSQVLAPAETLARFGSPVSRALARDMESVSAALLAEPSFVSVFGRDGGSRLATDGETVVQADLAATISLLRLGGPAAFYSGQGGARLAAAVTAAGGSLAPSDMTGDEAAWQPTVQVETGDNIAHFPPPPFTGGVRSALIWAMLTDRDRFEDAEWPKRDQLYVEAARRADAERSVAASTAPTRAALDALVDPSRIHTMITGFETDRALPGGDNVAAPENPAAASVIAADREGNGVACSFTPNSLFGIGRIAGATGLIPAAAPGAGGRGATALTPMLMVNENSKEFRFAAAASGGSVASESLVETAAPIVLLGAAPEDAIREARIAPDGTTERVLVENTLPQETGDGLAAKGYRLFTTQPFGSVVVIACLEGLPPNPESCRAAADPRAFGLAASTD